MKKTFIIEHLEPEIGEWTFIEYRYISKIVGKNNLWFTNVSKNKDQEMLSAYGRVLSESVKKIKLKNPCILDPEAPQLLTPQNSSQFQYFVLGGILGDNPPQKRTREELTQFLKQMPAFNIGNMQMSTDNAVYTVKKIIEGTPFEKISFKDEIEIKINKIESTILPYRYVLVKGKPLLSPDLLNYLKTH
ncbi:MAG: SAM-dependent methyltransferase [Nanoarchaeota archaeon]